MKTQKHKIPIILSLLFGITAAHATQQDSTHPTEPGSYMVSDQLYDVIESWHNGYSQTMPLLTYVLEVDESIMKKWINHVQRQISFSEIQRYFASRFPIELDEANEALGDTSIQPFLYYFHMRYPGAFMTWQVEQLEPAEVSLEHYLSKTEPELLLNWREAKTALKPNRYGSFSELLAQQTHADDVQTEGLRLLSKMQDRGGEGEGCVCSVVSAFQALPVNRETATFLDEEFKNNGTLKERIRFDEAAKGAVHSGDLYRYIKSGLNAADFNRSNHVALRTSILCLGPYGDECQTGVCTGEMDFQAEYGSKVYVKTDVASSIWSKASVSLAADSAKLTYDPPGWATEQVLFNKGLAVEREQKTTWNEDAFMSLLEGALGIATVIATDGASIADLEFDMLDNTVTGILGLISHNGDGSGVVNKTFYANYDTATSAPILMESGKSYRIELSSLGRVFGRGWGPKSWSWAQYNSSSWFVSAIKNYSCADGAIPPGRAGFWSFNSEGGPHSNSTLTNNVISFLYTELGYTGDVSTANSTGEVLMPNPQPPVVSCTVSPSNGASGLTSTLSAAGSYDPDGYIVDYTWNTGEVGAVVTHLFETTPDPFPYTITTHPVSVTVTDNSGFSTTQSCGGVTVCDQVGAFGWCLAVAEPDTFSTL